MLPPDLSLYLNRIGYSGNLRHDFSVLSSLHLHHATHIPFENIDVLLGKPIRLGIEHLWNKMVIQERGGYCLEQNLFFAAILERLGFSVRRLAARVRHRTTKVLPRTHMLLLVRIEERDWLVDVGFGGEGLLQPLPFGTGEISRQFAWTYRVIEVDGEWVLESRRGETWAALYSFTLTPQDIADFEMANHYVATHPDSRFVQTLTVQLPTPEVRYVLRNYELMLDKGDEVATQRITDHDRLLELLASRFGLRLPAGTRIPLTAESG